jgi:hypothetical protein
VKKLALWGCVGGPVVLAALCALLVALLSLFVFPNNLKPHDERRAEFRSRVFSTQNALLAPLETPPTADPHGLPVEPERTCHLLRAGEGPASCAKVPRIPDALVTRALGLKDEVLLKRESLKPIEVDLSWMRSLAGHDDWSDPTGTVLELIPTDARTLAELPVLDCEQVRAAVLLRLAQALDEGAVAPGIGDAAGLLQTLAGQPTLFATLCSQRTANQAIAAIKPTRVSGDVRPLAALAELNDFKRREIAAAIWHPWVESSVRERALLHLTPFERCIAAVEGATVLEVGALLDERYPGHRTAFETWLRGPGGCQQPVAQAAAEKSRAADWRPILRRRHFVTDDNWLWSFFTWSSKAYRAAELEKLLEDTAPFSKPNTAS